MRAQRLPTMQTKYRQHLGKTQGCVAWVVWFVGCLVCWLGRVVAWLIGRLVGTPLMDGCMDGWTDGWMDPRRPGQFPAVPVVPDNLCAVPRGQ